MSKKDSGDFGNVPKTYAWGSVKDSDPGTIDKDKSGAEWKEPADPGSSEPKDDAGGLGFETAKSGDGDSPIDDPGSSIPKPLPLGDESN